MSKRRLSSVSLPAAWPRRARSAVIHAMSLAAAALTATRGWAATHVSSGVRLRSEIERLRQEVALLQEEMRLKDGRMARVPGHARPHYPPIDRLAILELRAVRGWSLRQTADRFLLSPATVSHWSSRLGDEGPDALVRSPVPMNKYPDFVAHTVQRLKVLCPAFGYTKIAHVLCRAGLHLGTSTVKRMLRRNAAPEPEPTRRRGPIKKIVARYPHHVWHCDLTTVPTSMGFWSPMRPFGLEQRWPFCWWLVVLADQFSARILALALFRRPPSAEQVRAFVVRAARKAGVVPRYFVTDKGPQFRDRVFRRWCKRTGIRHRFGALGQFGSIPFVERLIRTVKWECTARILFPFSGSAARKELALFQVWYNRVRPHERLAGATPEEVIAGSEPSWRRELFDPRDPSSRSARLALRVRYLGARKHLPIVRLERAA